MLTTHEIFVLQALYFYTYTVHIHTSMLTVSQVFFIRQLYLLSLSNLRQ